MPTLKENYWALEHLLGHKIVMGDPNNEDDMIEGTLTRVEYNAYGRGIYLDIDGKEYPLMGIVYQVID